MCCRIWCCHQAAFRGLVARRRAIVNCAQQDSYVRTVCVIKALYNHIEIVDTQLVVVGCFLLFFSPQRPSIPLLRAELYYILITLNYQLALNRNPCSVSAFGG